MSEVIYKSKRAMIVEIDGLYCYIGKSGRELRAETIRVTGTVISCNGTGYSPDLDDALCELQIHLMTKGSP